MNREILDHAVNVCESIKNLRRIESNIAQVKQHEETIRVKGHTSGADLLSKDVDPDGSLRETIITLIEAKVAKRIADLEKEFAEM